MDNKHSVKTKVRDALIRASSELSESHVAALKRYCTSENCDRAKWVLKKVIENNTIAKERKVPLCDDTGIPHLIVETGRDRDLGPGFFHEIQEGIKCGLRKLPGRPMAVKGNEIVRVEQSQGLEEDPGEVLPAPILMLPSNDNFVKIHLLMQGGGPEIRGKTYRVFHQHDFTVVIDEIIRWAIKRVRLLGCLPCSPAIGIGRTHYEASALMLLAMAQADFNSQTDIEKKITQKINDSGPGPLGLGGKTTALASFLKIGPQRASGVRIVCLRLCCMVEPRSASVIL